MLAIIVSVFYTYIAMRLVCYQRNGARFRKWISAGAYLLMVGAFSRMVTLVIEQHPAHWSELVVAVGTALLVYRSRGNFACLIKPPTSSY